MDNGQEKRELRGVLCRKGQAHRLDTGEQRRTRAKKRSERRAEGGQGLRQKSNRRDEVGISEALVRGGGSEQMGPRMGENNKLGIGGRENTGLDTHFGTEEE